MDVDPGEILRHPTLAGLLALSVVAFAVGMERLSFAFRQQRRLRCGRDSIVGHLQRHEITMAQAVNSTAPRHAATALLDLVLAAPPTDEAPGAVRRGYARVVRRAQARLWILGSIASIAPFVGLLGTVLGVMQAFSDMGAAGTGGFDVVSTGISEALVTTAVGIFVGIEAVLLFNYLKVRLADYAAELREAVEEITEAHRGSASSHAS